MPRTQPGGRGSVSWREPTAILAVLVAAAAILVSVTTPIDDPDIWQHLLVGKAIWRLHAIPMEHQWSWPSYGRPEVLPSWGFRALLWPFWDVGQAWGLYGWRWITTLGAFAALWMAARSMGARGLSALWVLVLCALSYRARTEVRPETLVAVLLALQLWALESGHHRGADRSPWVVLIAWCWANVHISYYLGLALTGIHLVDAAHSVRRVPRMSDERSARARRARRLLLVAALSGAVSFLNPFGWRALWQPFEFFLYWRHEPIYRTIAELQPLVWGTHWKSGLPLLIAGWPVLVLWRSRRAGVDVAEVLTCAVFTILATRIQRFTGFYALVAAPYVARDLGAWLSTLRALRWAAASRPLAAGLASVACLLVGILEWSRPEYPVGLGFRWDHYPVRACDFMAEQGVRGRGFSPYHMAGYQLWRFWPDRDRLPFMDVHQTASREDRELYAYAFASHSHWEALDHEHQFDYALLEGHQEWVRGSRLMDFLDADSSWSLVFRDDAAALFVRRAGPLRRLVARHGYDVVPAGQEGLAALTRACWDDTVLRHRARAELERMVAGSSWNAGAHSLLATLAWFDGDPRGARSHLERALAVDPRTRDAHRRLGHIAMTEGRWRDAIRALRSEKALTRARDLDFVLALAYRRSGDLRSARTHYRRSLALDPANQAVRESLRVLEGSRE